MTFKNWLGYIIAAFHCLIATVFVFMTCFSTNVNHMLIIVFGWFLVVFLWYLLGYCFMAVIENKLLYNTYSEEFWFLKQIKKISPTLFRFFTFSITVQPILYLTIALYRIKLLCKNS